ncbi:hypothetical protein CVT25_003449 [Psilocybe cyanescens]|uniref:Protein kinase domain-containing protein n=1 Tax=Psilocybe cyanescens TaxID=93625 RepID=A0A409WM28_PSICY|nr:hypothetical protein CVT25_003449 [Psilocybe cyanescens]
MRTGTTHLLLSLGKSLAQITAELAPVPALFPLVDALCGIIQLCENVAHNRHSARQLCDRCHILVLAMREYQEKAVNDNIVQARNAVLEQLTDIQYKMSEWANLGRLKSLVNQDIIAKDIANCHTQITDCINNFHLTSHFEIHEWMTDFQKNQRLDHAQLLQSLSQLQETTQNVEATTMETNIMMRQMMAMFQKAMGENKQNAAEVHKGLSTNLYRYQSQCKELLPDLHLQSGEVKKIGKNPVRKSSSGMLDIYEGLYLGSERVDIKVIHSMNFDERNIRRFRREAKIWGQVWKRDQGQHIVPFYGFCQMEDEPHPCMISPWQKNGDALAYVKANDLTVDYIKFVGHITRGVAVLHNMNLVHGDIRSLTILVNEKGLPLLSDFRVSKIIEDASAAPLTQSSGMMDKGRYSAPEMFQGDGVLSSATDIYSLAMTILEIMTHKQPYPHIKHHLVASREAYEGKHPQRPTEPEVSRRGLDDGLWKLMVDSWSLDPSKRPSVHAYLEYFAKI